MAQEAAAAVQAVVRPTIGNMSEMRQALWENMVPGSQEFPVLPQMFKTTLLKNAPAENQNE